MEVSLICIGYGKTPLIYAIEYRTCLSDPSEEDLIEFLVRNGSNVNHVDMSGLTPLFYAIYRGVPSIVAILLENHADYHFENFLGYSPFRYALGCLSYSNPNEEDIYLGRLKVVEILLEKFQSNRDELKQAIIGSTPNIPYLFPLFDFIFYCRMENRSNLESIAWEIFQTTSWPCPRTYGNLLIGQNLIVFHQHLEHIVYFLQRMYIDNYQQLLLFYLQRVIKETESSNRFFFLLFCAFLEMSGNHLYTNMLRYFLDNQRIYLFKQRREMIKSILILCQQAPIRLTALCRRKVRQTIQTSIDRHVFSFDRILPRNLQRYVLLEELSSFIYTPPTTKRLLNLIEQSIFTSKILLQ